MEIVRDHKGNSDDPEQIHQSMSMYCVIPIKTFDQNSKMNEHTFGFFFVWVSCSVSNFVVSYMNSHMPHAATPTPFLTISQLLGGLEKLYICVALVLVVW